MFCHKCGETLPDHAEFCSRCGAKTIRPVTEQSEPPAAKPKAGLSTGKTVALIAGILVGMGLLAVIGLAALGHLVGDTDPEPESRPVVTTEPQEPPAEEPLPDEPEPVELAYQGVSLSGLLGSDPEKVREEFGEPVSGTPVDGTMYEGGEYYGYEGILFVIDYQTETIGWILARADTVERNGDSLDKTPEELRALLGTPGQEENVCDDEGMTLWHCMRYPLETAVMDIIMPDAESKAGTVTFSANGFPYPVFYEDEGLLFRGVSTDLLLGASYDTVVGLLGEPDSVILDGEEITYGDVSIYFDLWSTDTPYLFSISSPSPEDFTYNGQPLTTDYEELTQIFGREPDNTDVFYDTYSMDYRLEHLGSEAFLWIETPATEESSADTRVSLSWWAETETEETYDPTDSLPALPAGFEWVEAPTVVTTDQFGSRYLTGVIRNNSGSTKSVAIYVNLYDANGYLIENTADYVTNLGNGASWKFSAYVSSQAAAYEITEITAR